MKLLDIVPALAHPQHATFQIGITVQSKLTIESYMPSNGLIFSDGIETDFLKFNSGSIAIIGIAKEKANLVLG
ncbi:MAG: hypothetical protein ABIS01_08135 [Ferruginibacter sp.]